ncbi:MAG: lipopolysaccharide biosynthesis protein [Minisyncoccota bacterium]
MAFLPPSSRSSTAGGAPPRKEAAGIRGSARAMLGGAGSFRRDALVLTGGTFAAQALPLLLYPVFTRIYAPADFGVFATISLCATVASLLGSGAFEHAILIARTRRQAAHVAAWALTRSVLVLIGLLAVIVPLGDWAARRGAVDVAVVPWLVLVPLIAAGQVVSNCYGEWCVRNEQFADLSKLRIWQTSSIAAARLGFGLALPSINGVVAGDAVGKTASAFRSAAMVWSRDRPYLHIHTWRRMRDAARRYANVARFALPDQVINNLGGSIHVLFLGAAFGTRELGFLSLVLSLMYVPVTVVSSAVKDVFRQRASVEYASTGSCRATYRRLLVPVTALAVVGFGTLYLISPWLFPFALGSEWAVAGEYARILTPLFFSNFVSMSLGGVLVIAERTDVSLAWQVANLLLTLGALLIGTRVLNEMSGSLWCFSLARTLSYASYMALSYRYAERRPARIEDVAGGGNA